MVIGFFRQRLKGIDTVPTCLDVIRFFLLELQSPLQSMTYRNLARGPFLLICFVFNEKPVLVSCSSVPVPLVIDDKQLSCWLPVYFVSKTTMLSWIAQLLSVDHGPLSLPSTAHFGNCGLLVCGHQILSSGLFFFSGLLSLWLLTILVLELHPPPTFMAYRGGHN